ncbi:MAG: exported protein of unknown function [Chlorobi bacterium]|nr:exported protein of unknown function [Chlorobiota bacterium]
MKAYVLLAGLGVLTLFGCKDDTTSPGSGYVGKEMVVYSTEDSTLHHQIVTYDPVTNPAGDNPKLLIDDARLVTSPRGGKIAYLIESTSGSVFQISVANIDGSGNKVIASSSTFETAVSYPALSPDGKSVVYSTKDGRLLIQNSDGTGEAKVISTNATYETIPEFSPNGGQIAFYHGDGGTDLYVVNADGGNLHSIASNAQDFGQGDSRMAWSPDGTKLAYTGTATNSDGDIFVVNADGSNRKNITNDAPGDLQPAWSPDGTKLAFSTVSTDLGAQIIMINADGTGRTLVTPNVMNNDVYPTWSPDGKYILYTSRYQSNPGTLRAYTVASADANSVGFKVYKGFWGKF